jgi:sorting nexin-41/42
MLICPPIPPRHSLGDYAVKQGKAKEDANVIARRKRMLTVFLNRLGRHPILGEDRVFLRFLQPKASWVKRVVASFNLAIAKIKRAPG